LRLVRFNRLPAIRVVYAGENHDVLALSFCDRIDAAAWLLDETATSLLEMNRTAATVWDRRSPSHTLEMLLDDLLVYDGGAWVKVDAQGLRRALHDWAAGGRRPAALRNPVLGWQPVELSAVAAQIADVGHTGWVLVAARRGKGPSFGARHPCLPEEPGPDLMKFASHELNNITAAIGGFAELASEHPDLATSPAGAYLREIAVGAARMRRLASLLGVFGDASMPAPAEFALRRWIDDGGGTALPANWHFEFRCPATTLLQGDLAQAQRGLRHLVEAFTHVNLAGGADCRVGVVDAASLLCDACGGHVGEPCVEIAVPVAGLATRSSGARITALRDRFAGYPYGLFELTAAIACMHRAGGHVRVVSAPPGIALMLAALQA